MVQHDPAPPSPGVAAFRWWSGCRPQLLTWSPTGDQTTLAGTGSEHSDVRDGSHRDVRRAELSVAALPPVRGAACPGFGSASPEAAVGGRGIRGAPHGSSQRAASTLDAALAASLAAVPTDLPRRRVWRCGDAVADAIYTLAPRRRDPHPGPPYVPERGPGQLSAHPAELHGSRQHGGRQPDAIRHDERRPVPAERTTTAELTPLRPGTGGGPPPGTADPTMRTEERTSSPTGTASNSR